MAEAERKESKMALGATVVVISFVCLALICCSSPAGFFVLGEIKREISLQGLPEAEYYSDSPTMDFGTIRFEGKTYELDNVGRINIDENACGYAIAKLEHDGFKEIIYKPKFFDAHDRIIVYDTGLMGTGFTLYKRAGIESLLAINIRVDTLSVHTSKGVFSMHIYDKNIIGMEPAAISGLPLQGFPPWLRRPF